MISTALSKWDKLEKLVLSQAKNPDALREKAAKYAREFREKGYLDITPSKILEEDENLFPLFYKLLAGGAADNTASPVAGRRDSSWMTDADFCFLNIRALSPDPSQTGKISDALKILPVVRASSFHLAPFFDCTMDNLYAVDSLRIITQDIVDETWEQAGISPGEQMRILLDAIHILGKTAGFDLEPHTSQFSRIVMEYPQHFRWIRLNGKRDGLFRNARHETMLDEQHQKELVSEVRKIIAAELKKSGLASVEDLSRGVGTVRDCHQSCIKALIAAGYWTLPSHTWNGAGLPAFDKYNYEGNYPEFTYLDKNGEDQHRHSFGMLTPFALYTGLPFNSEPSEKNLPRYKEDTFKFVTELFPAILENYPFDYVRIDYVDHVFDSTVGGSFDIPVSDRMTPKVLKAVIDRARKDRPYMGATAERMGQDIDVYRTAGFDLVLGQDVLSTMNADYLLYCLKEQETLIGKSREEKWTVPASVMFSVDTHDSGHPLFWTKPLSDVEGAKGMALRHFLSRFLYAGTQRRPKYECMGNQDLSSGLYQANNKPVSLHWADDRDYCTGYHTRENIYRTVKDDLISGHMGTVHVYGRILLWFIDHPQKQQRIFCYAYLEDDPGQLKNLQVETPVYEDIHNFIVDVNEGSRFPVKKATYIDMYTGESNTFDIYDGKLNILTIEGLGFGMFILR